MEPDRKSPFLQDSFIKRNSYNDDGNKRIPLPLVLQAARILGAVGGYKDFQQLPKDLIDIVRVFIKDQHVQREKLCLKSFGQFRKNDNINLFLSNMINRKLIYTTYVPYNKYGYMDGWVTRNRKIRKDCILCQKEKYDNGNLVKELHYNNSGELTKTIKYFYKIDDTKKN